MSIANVGGIPKRSKHHNKHHHYRKSIGSVGRQASLASHTTGTPVSSPSDDPGSNSDTEDANLLLHSASRSNIKTMIYNDEAETSFMSPAGGGGMPIGKKHALKKYDQFVRNTSCFCTA